MSGSSSSWCREVSERVFEVSALACASGWRAVAWRARARASATASSSSRAARAAPARTRLALALAALLAGSMSACGKPSEAKGGTPVGAAGAPVGMPQAAVASPAVASQGRSAAPPRSNQAGPALARAVDYERLKELLPDIAGWTRSEVTGEQLTTPVAYAGPKRSTERTIAASNWSSRILRSVRCCSRRYRSGPRLCRAVQ